jgi:hypothetical protein
MDAPAQRHLDEGLKRALLTYGTARALNSVVSIVQGTDVVLEPGGVGVKFSPGQALRPINDLIGQFADLMLYASIVFGAMEILIRIGGHWMVSFGLSVAAVAWASYELRKERSPAWIGKLLLMALLLRFAVPLVALGNEGIYSAFMASDYAASQAAIQASAGQLGEGSVTPNEPGAERKQGGLLDWFNSKAPKADAKAEPTVVERLKEWFSQKGDVSARLKMFVQSANNAVEHVVRLMVVFVLQTLVVPLILAWALMRGAAAVLQIKPRA